MIKFFAVNINGDPKIEYTLKVTPPASTKIGPKWFTPQAGVEELYWPNPMKFVCTDTESTTDSYTFEVCIKKKKGKDKLTRDVKQLIEDGRKGISHIVGPFKVTIFVPPTKSAPIPDLSADLAILRINPLSARVGNRES